MGFFEVVSPLLGASQPFINSFCQPHFNGTWASITNELGPFTPCFIDIVILGIAHVTLIVFAILRLIILFRAPLVTRQCLKSRWIQAVRSVLAVACFIVPLMQLSARASLDDLGGGRENLPPSEVVSLILTSVAWALASVAFVRELSVYVKKGDWYLRFGVVFVLIGQLAELHYVVQLLEYYNDFFVGLFITFTAFHVLLGLLAVLYYPDLKPGPQYRHTDDDIIDGGVQYVALPGQASSEVACPEYHVNHGYRHPLQDTDVWGLDPSDQSASVSQRFLEKWNIEKERPKPWLLRALHASFGARFWLGGVFKIGNDAAQFVGPLMLKSLLASMQDGEPAWHGYMYACIIFVGLMVGVLCEAQYFQNVMRVGFHIRTALVASVFRKSLRLSYGGRSNFSSGRIVNMMTSDAEAMSMVCQNLHNLWSAPMRIVIAMVLLYAQLGVSSLLGLSILVLMIPVQAFVVNKNQKMQKQVLQRGDRRVALMNEILSSMDVVKCYAWEESFQKNILAIRAEELQWLRKSQYVMALNYLLLNIVPVLVTVIGFGGYALLGGNLTADRAFTSITLFNVLRFPLYTFPQLINQVVQANVSLTRLQELLLAEERHLDAFPSVDPKLPAVEFNGGSFNWDPKVVPPVLQDIELKVPVGSLVAVIGGTGQGKSSLVSAMLGEVPPLDPKNAPVVRGRVAYVPQVAWIFNASVRDNVLFGLPYDRPRYQNAIRVSALERDLELLPGGDLTEIGERGVNVSGGQKQRISIARAVYADADVYIFDDPLSALDAHVAKQVFESCVTGSLKGKTRVVVTNQLHFLPAVDLVVLLQDGRIAEQGTYEELKSGGEAFNELMEQAGSLEEGGTGDVDSAIAHVLSPKPDPPTGGGGKEQGAAGGGGEEVPYVVAKKALKKRRSFAQRRPDDGDAAALGADGPGGKERAAVALVKSEEREVGRISAAVLRRYVGAMGGWHFLFVLLGFYVLIEVAKASANVWVSYWSGASTRTDARPHSVSFYITVYASISVTQVFLTFCNQFWLMFSSIRAGRALHEGMLTAILRAPMAFFHANPQGRLINRFTRDTSDIDKNLAQFCSIFLSGCFSLVSTFAIIGLLDTVALWAIVPLVLVFYFVYLYFQTTMREAKRLDSISRSPVYTQFGEALNGLSTIRAYRAHERMASINGRAVDRNVRYTLLNMSANRWLAIRLEFLGGLMIFATAIFAVLDSARAADQAAVAPLLGLILSYALSITSLMTMTLRLASVAENSFNAVERVGAYSEVAPEAPPVVEDSRPPPEWPAEGAITFDRVVMRYREDLPPVLQGLTADVKGGEKVGVVGRTGAGTVRFNLDPFDEHSDAAIWESLARAHLKELISRLPNGLETLLSRSQLRSRNITSTMCSIGSSRSSSSSSRHRSCSSSTSGPQRWPRQQRALLSRVVEGGDNFSVGQRQLLSLARALLRRSKVLVLDEATAAVDVGTDALIQKTIREEFKECTMLIIAHRLNTIIDSDRILVMDAGKVGPLPSAPRLQLPLLPPNTPSLLLSLLPGAAACPLRPREGVSLVVEYDTAKALLEKKGLFHSMVQSTGASNAKYLERIALGEVDVEAELAVPAAEEKKKWARQAASQRWASATQWAMALTLTSSQRDLQDMALREEEDEDDAGEEGSLIEKVRDAAMTLQTVLAGERSSEIANELSRRGVPEERWWYALLRVRLTRTRAVKSTCAFTSGTTHVAYPVCAVLRQIRFGRDGSQGEDRSGCRAREWQ
eukprot:jgi/Mesen1/1171/ME000124S00204